ncbi:MAG: hypothetical protein QOD04_8, partial [Pseudonocardiales bacterium]|nr:hypothetical protein [Pseudonocardiales bacterium]
MIPTSAALLVLGVLLAEPVSRALAAARWPARDPTGALLLWQAVGLTGALLLLEVVGMVALAPAGPTPRRALAALPRPLPWWALLAAAVFVAVLLRLAAVLVVSAVRTVRARHRHRVLVDLVATRNPLLRGASVLDHDLPVAYCLPGLRPRVVLSRGAVTRLEEAELRAVLAHEVAHVV